MVELVEAKELKWVPTGVAKKMLRISKQRVYQLVNAGLLAGCRVDGTLMVSVHSVEERIAWLKNQEEMYGEI